jgi:AcrR family transcriptional regulator
VIRTAPTERGAAARRRGPSKGDERERAILEHATELFGRKPISSITTDELAAGAGLSRSSFYFYFPSKHAVLAALISDLGGELTAGHNRWLDGTGRDDDAQREASVHTAVLWRTHGALIEQARKSATDYRPVIDFLDAATRRFTSRLSARIVRDREAGLAPDGIAPLTLARMIDAVRCARFAELIGRSDARGDARAVADVLTLTNRMIYGMVPPDVDADPD